MAARPTKGRKQAAGSASSRWNLSEPLTRQSDYLVMCSVNCFYRSVRSFDRCLRCWVLGVYVKVLYLRSEVYGLVSKREHAGGRPLHFPSPLHKKCMNCSKTKGSIVLTRTGGSGTLLPVAQAKAKRGAIKAVLPASVFGL